MPTFDPRRRLSARFDQAFAYASLLHDFGKVGVREEVLVKARKLYPAQMELIRRRFQYVRKSLELENHRRRLEFVLRNEAREVATTGYTVQMMLDAERNLLMLPPPFYREFLDRWRKGELG